ncbi:MAG: L,D-transpeptidase family protein [Minisyncoccia bacterium]
MRPATLIFLGVLLGFVGTYTFQHFFSVRTLAQGIEEYIPNKLGQKLTPPETSKNFLESEITRLKESGDMFVLANLTTMQLDVYEKGVSTLALSIQAKGREGSWWETPAGVYSIKIKSKNHLSSIGNVYMPWSMQFQGNFFIHGLPYYQDGTLVSTSYSGGCIRLHTDDAKKVFERVTAGVPVVVYEDSTQPVDTRTGYTFGPQGVSAERFLVADLTDGFTFASHGVQDKIEASVATNLLTAIVSAEYMDIERNITADTSDQVTTIKPRLKSGEKYSVYDYLYILLQESSQEAAHVLARALGLSRTVDLITQKAKAIGMEESIFTDARAVSQTNITTLTDTYQLLRYMYFNRKFLLTISANTAETRIYGSPKFSNIENFNLFKDDSQFVGGFVSSSGTTGVFVFDISFGDTVRPVAIVVESSKNIIDDVNAMRVFVQTSFRK